MKYRVEWLSEQGGSTTVMEEEMEAEDELDLYDKVFKYDYYFMSIINIDEISE